MRLPFTETQFLDIFGAYNSALWPAVVVLWIATLGLSVALVRGRAGSVVVSAFAALHWAWTGVAYHAIYFTRINPAAWIFAALFVAQSLAFVWFGVLRRRLRFSWGRTPRHAIAGLFVGYSILYPVLVLLSGHEAPRAPIFAVPCPTALFTAGLLFAAVPPIPRPLLVVPILWSLVGGSAALVLEMTPDLMLFLAAACLLIAAALPRRLTGTTGT